MKDNVVTGSVGGIKPQRPHSRHQAALLYIDSVSNKVKHKSMFYSSMGGSFSISY